MKPAHIAALIMWSVAGVLLLTSLLYGSWWSEHDMRVGLGSYTTCIAPQAALLGDRFPCETQSFMDALGDVSPDTRFLTFVWAGRATFAFSIGLVAAIAGAWVLLVGRGSELGFRLIFVVTLFLAATAIAFVVASKGGMEVGGSFYMTFGAIALALFGCFARAIFPTPGPYPIPPRPGPRPRRFAIKPTRAIAPPLRALEPGSPVLEPLRHHERPTSSAPIGPWDYASPKQHPHAKYAPPGLILDETKPAPLACPRCASPASDEYAPFCGQCHGFLLSA